MLNFWLCIFEMLPCFMRIDVSKLVDDTLWGLFILCLCVHPYFACCDVFNLLPQFHGVSYSIKFPLNSPVL